MGAPSLRDSLLRWHRNVTIRFDNAGYYGPEKITVTNTANKAPYIAQAANSVSPSVTRR